MSSEEYGSSAVLIELTGNNGFCSPVKPVDFGSEWTLKDVSRRMEGLSESGRSERKKEFSQRQTIEVVRGDAAMQKWNLTLILYERKTMIHSVLTSNYKHRLLFQKKLLMYCLFDKLQFHNSENHQQNTWI